MFPGRELRDELRCADRLDVLGDQLAEQQKRADNATGAQGNLKAQVQQLTAGNRELTHEMRMLPWWRDAVYSAVIFSLLLLGVAAGRRADGSAPG